MAYTDLNNLEYRNLNLNATLEDDLSQKINMLPDIMARFYSKMTLFPDAETVTFYKILRQ